MVHSRYRPHRHGSREIATFRVALTFDAEHPDRPNDGDRTLAILRTLAGAEARATFFIQGRWAEAYPQVAAAAADGGHLIGNHSHYHARMPLFSPAGLVQDVTDADAVIRSTTGHDPRPWFRAPFGNGADQAELVVALRSLGYRHVGWHVSAEEWEPGRSEAEVVERVVGGVREHGDGAIVLLHTWPRPVAGALPEIIKRLLTDGASFVGVDHLDLPPGPEPIGEPRPGLAQLPAGAG